MFNAFVHVKLHTGDTAGAKKFYGDLFSWKMEDVPMGDFDYTMVQVGEGTGGGILQKTAADAPSQLVVSANAGVRAYRTSNLMRFETDPQGAGVTEFSLGVNLMTPSFPFLSKEVEPSLTFMSQRAYYGQFRPAGGDVEKDNVKNFMDYEFRMINLAGASQVSKEWRVTGAVEYDELRSFRAGQKMYYSFSPIFSITK